MSGASESGKFWSRNWSSRMAMSDFSSVTSLMVTKLAPAALACSTKSFHESGSSSSKMTVGTYSVMYPLKRRMPWPAMNATMSSFSEIRLSDCIANNIVAGSPDPGHADHAGGRWDEIDRDRVAAARHRQGRGLARLGDQPRQQRTRALAHVELRQHPVRQRDQPKAEPVRAAPGALDPRHHPQR